MTCQHCCKDHGYNSCERQDSDRIDPLEPVNFPPLKTSHPWEVNKDSFRPGAVIKQDPEWKMKLHQAIDEAKNELERSLIEELSHDELVRLVLVINSDLTKARKEKSLLNTFQYHFKLRMEPLEDSVLLMADGYDSSISVPYFNKQEVLTQMIKNTKMDILFFEREKLLLDMIRKMVFSK